MALEVSEKEIVIQKSDDDKTFQVYCSSSKMRTKIEKAGYKPYKIEEDGTGYYSLPSSAVSFRKPSQKTMSEENKKAAAERMRKMHESKKKV